MIGVVIVTYNGVDFLEKCLAGLRSEQLNVIVVDNCSEDLTVDTIKGQYSWINLIELNENLGFGRANNIGIKQAFESQCDSVLLMNQDVYLDIQVIERINQLIMVNEGYGVLSPMHYRADREDFDYYFSGYISPKKCKLLFDMVSQKKTQPIYEVPFVNAAIWMIKLSTIKHVGAFDPLFDHYGEDIDWINRLVFHGYKVGVCPQLSGIHDRSQERFDNRKYSFRKAVSNVYVGELVKLKDINKPFLSQVRVVHFGLIKSIIYSSLKLNRKSLVFMFVFIRLLYNTRGINKSRRMCKNECDYRFL